MFVAYDDSGTHKCIEFDDDDDDEPCLPLSTHNRYCILDKKPPKDFIIDDWQTGVLALAVINKSDVNIEILENLKLIWGGDSEARVAQKHQNAVGVIARLVNKELSTGAAPTSEEIAIKEAINDQLEAHEAILKEGRRIKALTPISNDYKTLLQAVM